MSIRQSFGLFAAAVVAVVGVATLPSRFATAGAGEPPAEWDGLVRTEHKQLDAFYVLPDAQLSSYKRIRLDPAQVSFAKNWKPNESQRNPSARLNDQDIERIRSGVATEFDKVFRDELSKAGYVLTDTDGEDVLRTTPMIVNLYIAAPDKMTPGRSTTYTSSTGQLSLVLALSDSVTGEHLVRAVDTHRGRDTGRFQVSNSVYNLATAREAFDKWARIFVAELNDAKSGASAR